MSDTDKKICAACEEELPFNYLMCDLDTGDQVYCGPCFEKHPCGKGEHGEGCPTLVFNA